MIWSRSLAKWETYGEAKLRKRQRRAARSERQRGRAAGREEMAPPVDMASKRTSTANAAGQGGGGEKKRRKRERRSAAGPLKGSTLNSLASDVSPASDKPRKAAGSTSAFAHSSRSRLLSQTSVRLDCPRPSVALELTAIAPFSASQ